MTYVAFLRAINVGGHAIVRMSALREAFTAAGCKAVRTYIQSGNVIFDAPGQKAFPRIRLGLRRLLGEAPEVLFRTPRQLAAIVAADPFKRLRAERALKFYVTFLSRAPRRAPRLPLRSRPEALDVIAVEGREAFIVSRRKKSGFYGFPNNYIEKELGVPATSRNWSTVSKIAALARGDA